MRKNSKLIIGDAELSNKDNLTEFESIKIECKNYINGKDITVMADYILESFNGQAESLKWGLSDYSKNILLPCKVTTMQMSLSMFSVNPTKRYTLYNFLLFEGYVESPHGELDEFKKLLSEYKGTTLTDLFIPKWNELNSQDYCCYAVADVGYIAILGKDGCSPVQQILECYKDGNLMIQQSDKQNILELVNMQKYYKDSYMCT